MRLSDCLIPGCLLLSMLFPPGAAAQKLSYNPVFDDSSVPRITIQIDQNALNEILAPGNEFSDQEFNATFIFNSPQAQDTLLNVGFRLRGNTSRRSQKKSFKVSFNTFEPGRKYHGLEKLNLNGEHNDPSIIRSKLSWDLFQSQGLPASRANHIELYINEEYRGLYINVEHIDEQFLDTRFGNNEGNLYKCLYPADLVFLGPDGDDYNFLSGDRRAYDLKLRTSDEGAYDDLAHFIDVLNNVSDNNFQNALEEVFDVNSYLKMLAIEVLTGSWDGYWFLKNNFYLYFNPKTNLFHFIPFDYDNTFGIDFLGQDWGPRNVYNWGHPAEARPLTTRILNVSVYRNRFTFYLKKLLAEEFVPAVLFPRIDQLLNMILPAAESDLFRTLDYGYDNDSFVSSFTEALGNHVPYGLKPYIETRYNNALTQLDSNTNVSPIIDEGSIVSSPKRPAPGDPITVFVAIEDESANLNVIMEYRLNQQSWEVVTLADDGLADDKIAQDGIYSGSLAPFAEPGALSYIISARDESGQTSFARTRMLEIGFPTVNLHINEMMASNTTTVQDAAGEFDDWVELFNSDPSPLSLEGLFLTDNLDIPDKWPLPQMTLDPATFLLIWLDGDIAQGPLHAPFKLSAGGEEIGLFGMDANGFYPIDTLSFSIQSTDHSYARTTDGAGDFRVTSEPTPGKSNGLGGVYLDEETTMRLATMDTPYPNPFTHQTTIAINLSVQEHIKLEVFDVLGRNLVSLSDGILPPGRHDFFWNGLDREGNVRGAGIYFIQMKRFISGERITRKVIYLGL